MVHAKAGEKPLSIAIEEMNAGELKILAENAEEEQAQKEKIRGRCHMVSAFLTVEKRRKMKYEYTFYFPRV